MRLTEKEAYLAMFYYLEHLYDLTGSDYLGGLLGSMMLLEENVTADPALWKNWQNAVEKALEGSGDQSIKLDLKKE